MADDLDEVARAAALGDHVALAAALVRRASAKLEAGAFADAADDLGAAADLHRGGGRVLEESRALQARATVLRTAGNFELALACALRAKQLAPDESPQRVSAETELGENLLVRGRPRDALAAYEAALQHGVPIGMLPVVQAALHRRMALAASSAGDHEGAATHARRAAELFAEAGNAAGVAVARAEAATALVAAGLDGGAADPTRAIDDARAAAGDDPTALADVALLEVAQAIASGEDDDALDHARAARQHALDGGSVLHYAAAAIATADLLDARDDRAGAYESLAVGWATAGDKIGNEHAAVLFRPRLEHLRVRWGITEFERVRDAYYARRTT